MARENTLPNGEAYDGYDQSNNDPRLVDADFVKNQGLSAKATDFSVERKAANDPRMREEAANDALYNEQLQTIAVEEAERATRRALLRRQKTIEKQGLATGSTSKARSVKGLARWGGVAVAGTAWFWQFVCAGISLVGIGLWATLGELINGNWVGRSINWVMGLFGTRLENLIPVDSFALAFWALATIIALCTFIGFLIWFYITGAHVFHTPITALITSLTFALSILPVSNLFPWIPLWVLYINITSTAEWLKVLRPGKKAVMGGV